MSQNLPVLDLRNSGNHPLSLRYSEIYSHALIDAPFQDGRAQPGLSLAEKTPFVLAARAAVQHGIDKASALRIIYQILNDYYHEVQPASAAHWLGLSTGASPQLTSAPPWGAVFPWRARTLSSYQQAYEKAALEENRVKGREIGIEDGWLFCGPVSLQKITIEAERILYVLRQIDAHGYIRSDSADGDVKATALVDEKQRWKWLITAGNHRAAAAAALGYPSLPVRINLVISRSDVSYWNQVKDGLFTEQQALMIFDNIFNASPVAVVKQWCDKV